MVDMSGQARSDEELQEAIDCIKTVMLKHSLVLPMLTVNSGTILNCLEELKAYRLMLKEARKHRESMGSSGTECDATDPYRDTIFTGDE